MSKKVILFLTGFLFCLNILAWQAVFVLNQPQFLKVNFLDVGQGDSIFIQTPQNHQILIDGGPNSAILGKLGHYLPFWDRTIDLVILSHPDKDHMSGILDVLERYKVDYFLWTGVIKNNAENKKLSALLEKIQNIPPKFLLASLMGKTEPSRVLTVKVGTKIKAGNVSIDILYPLENLAGQEFKSFVNETSVVNKITYGNNSFLFVGDIGFSQEKLLSNLKSDVLKVAHHGSKYSTSNLFLENVKPEFAVIEVGKNSYGHPTPEVLQRLNNFGIKIFITQRDGDIEFISDGKTIQIN